MPLQLYPFRRQYRSTRTPQRETRRPSFVGIQGLCHGDAAHYGTFTPAEEQNQDGTLDVTCQTLAGAQVGRLIGAAQNGAYGKITAIDVQASKVTISLWSHGAQGGGFPELPGYTYARPALISDKALVVNPRATPLRIYPDGYAYDAVPITDYVVVNGNRFVVNQAFDQLFEPFIEIPEYCEFIRPGNGDYFAPGLYSCYKIPNWPSVTLGLKTGMWPNPAQS